MSTSSDTSIPPPPPPPAAQNSASINLRTQLPAYISPPPPQPSSQTALTGPYFFYGTLSSPSLLQEIISLDIQPTLRPASITGYELKLWGPDPALVKMEDGDGVVHGFEYHVESVEHAGRLAEYETGNYRAVPCEICYSDSDGEELVEQGQTFLYVGDDRDLHEGEFDLNGWLRTIGRAAG
ncbi:hypothetical protein BJX70DRAFT_85391 [Aspergillus crustosus]